MIKGIDVWQFQRLVGDAISDVDLFSFYRLNRIKLMQGGAKLDNLPRGKAASIEHLVRMDDRAFRVFRTQYVSVFPKDELRPAQEIADEYRKYRESVMAPELETIRPLAKSVLFYLLSEPAPTEIVDLFTRPKIAESNGDERKIGEERRVANQSGNELDLAELRELAYQVIDVQLPGEVIDVSTDASLFISGLRALKKRDIRTGRLAQERLSTGNPRVAILEEVIERVLGEVETGARRVTGLEIEPIIERHSIEKMDPESFEVLGVCTESATSNASLHPSFVEVIGVRVGDHWIALGEELLKEWIPYEGRLIAFHNQKVSRPRKDEVGIWTIEPLHTANTANRIRYRLKAKAGQVYEVFDLSCSREDADGIRSEIQKHHTQSHMRPIFRTTEGRLIRVPKDTFEFPNESFDEPLHTWSLLKVIEWRGRRFVTHGLPAVEGRLDCREIDRVLPALILQAAKVAGIAMTRKDAGDLIDAVVAIRGNTDPIRAKAIARELDDQIANIANLQSIVAAVVAHPRIKAEIQLVKNAAVEEAVQSRSDLSDELGLLRLEKLNLERSIKDKRSELQRLPAQVSKQVKEVFDKAASDGIEILGQIGLLSAFLHPMPTTPNGGVLLPSSGVTNHPIRKGTPTAIQADTSTSLLEKLSKSGIAKRDARSLASAMSVVIDAGLVLVLSGTAAATIARVVASTCTAKTAIVRNVEPGAKCQLLDYDEIQDPNRLWDIVLLQNFNLAPQEVYGADLFERLTAQAIEEDKPTLAAIATYSSGVAGLPISPSVRNICVAIDLDLKVPEEVGNDISMWQHALADDSDAVTVERPWDASVRRLASALHRAEPPPDGAVLAILDQGLRYRHPAN